MTKTLGSTTVFNIDINKKLSLNIESAYQSDFWIMAEFGRNCCLKSGLVITGIQYIKKYRNNIENILQNKIVSLNCNYISKYNCFYCIFLLNKCSLGEHSRLLSKILKSLTNSKHTLIYLYIFFFNIENIERLFNVKRCILNIISHLISYRKGFM